MRASEAIYLSNPKVKLTSDVLGQCTHLSLRKNGENLKAIKEARRLSPQAGYELFQQRRHLASIKAEIRSA